MSREILSFDEYDIDIDALELFRDGAPVQLSPAAVTLLTFLARRSGTLVRREELYEHLWPEGGVDVERLVNTYVRQVRAALGEHGGDDRFIRTYPRRGYRFLPEVSTRDARRRRLAAGSAGRGPLYRGWRVATAAGALVGLAAIAILYPDADRPVAEVLAELPEVARVEYLLGRELLDRPLPASRASAVPHFETAVLTAPDFAPAFTGLAESYVWAGRPLEAEQAARRALSLGAADGRAHMALGTSLLFGRWAWSEAEMQLRRAVDLAEDDPAVHLSLAFLLLSSERRPEGQEYLERARELEPAAADLTGDLGMLYGWLGDHETALELCARTTVIEPKAAWGYSCALEAGGALGRSDVVAENTAALVRLAGEDPEKVFRFGDAKRRIDEYFRFELERGTDMSHYRAARLWAQLGETLRALDELERAADERELGFVALIGEPGFRALHEHPRFLRMVEMLHPGLAPDLGAEGV